MKPIYFPNSYISETSAGILKHLFGCLTVYQPDAHCIPDKVHRLEAGGQIAIRVPLRGDETRIRRAMTAFQTWAELHHDQKDLKTVYRQSLENPIPFFEDTTVSRIREDIRRKGGPTRSPSEPGIQHRLFLSMAQQFDEQNESIDRKLQASEEMDRQLFNTLKGESEVIIPSSEIDGRVLSGRVNGRRVKERLRAWSFLFLHDAEVSDLFLTDCPAVKDTLDESPGNLESIFRLDNLPARPAAYRGLQGWCRDLSTFLSGLTKELGNGALTVPLKPFPADSQVETIDLAFYLVAGKSPDDFFRGFLNRNDIDAVPSNKKTQLNPINTLIGVLSSASGARGRHA